MIWLVLGLLLGYVIGKNHSGERVVVLQDKDLERQLTIAQNLNESLLQDKRDLQEELWKLKK